MKKSKKIDDNRWKFIDYNPIDEIQDNPIDRNYRNRQSMIIIDWIGLASLVTAYNNIILMDRDPRPIDQSGTK